MVGVGNTHVLQVGEPLASMYGYIYDGVYQQGETPIEGAFDPYPGGRKFKDVATLNEEGEVIYEPDGILSSADRTIIANPHPDFIWGFKNSFSYKGFDLNLFFQGSQGNDIYSYDLMAMNMMAGQWNATKAALNRWSPNNTNTDIPIAHRRARKISDRFVFDGSYIRLKNVMLGYNIPKNILNEVGIRSLKLFISAQNVLTITDYPGYDPEINYQASNRSLGMDSGGYPNIKSYTLGLNLGF
jgi:hypothetical protein